MDAFLGMRFSQILGLLFSSKLRAKAADVNAWRAQTECYERVMRDGHLGIALWSQPCSKGRRKRSLSVWRIQTKEHLTDKNDWPMKMMLMMTIGMMPNYWLRCPKRRQFHNFLRNVMRAEQQCYESQQKCYE